MRAVAAGDPVAMAEFVSRPDLPPGVAAALADDCELLALELDIVPLVRARR